MVRCWPGPGTPSVPKSLRVMVRSDSLSGGDYSTGMAGIGEQSCGHPSPTFPKRGGVEVGAKPPRLREGLVGAPNPVISAPAPTRWRGPGRFQRRRGPGGSGCPGRGRRGRPRASPRRVLRRLLAREAADEALPRDAEQQRAAEDVEGREFLEQQQVVRVLLAEADAGSRAMRAGSTPRLRESASRSVK
jgi:hypothetical protein